MMKTPFALNFAAKFCENHVPNEFHMFPGGTHGLSLATADPVISKRSALSVDWIRREYK